MYRRTWVLEPDKLHDGAQPVAIEVAKARLIGRPGIQCFKLQRRRRWLPGCPGRVDRYEPRGDRAGGEKTGHLRSLHHPGPAREPLVQMRTARPAVGPSAIVSGSAYPGLRLSAFGVPH
jgi:hypothetical protein